MGQVLSPVARGRAQTYGAPPARPARGAPPESGVPTGRLRQRNESRAPGADRAFRYVQVNAGGICSPPGIVAYKIGVAHGLADLIFALRPLSLICFFDVARAGWRKGFWADRGPSHGRG